MGLRKNGIKAIDKVVGKFQGIVKGLDDGISLCDEEIKENNKKLETLTKKNEDISTSKTQAVIFRDNLNSLINEKKSKKKKE